jgi:hypothetical protein
MSEFPFEFIFFPDEPDEKTIDSYSEFTDKGENKLDYLKFISKETIGNEFKEGFDNLSFLISKKIKKITIRVNLWKMYNNAYASYDASKSNPKNNFNEPYFTVSSEMLGVSLSFYDSGFSSLKNIRTWQHEIIHWMNSSLVQHNLEIVIERKKCPGSNFLNLICRYRKEGVAGLFETLRYMNPITSMELAREEFLKEIDFNFKQFHHAKYSINNLREKTLYELGPWMILHVLSCPKYSNKYVGIEEVLQNLKDSYTFDQLEQLILLEQALEIENYNFIKYLTEPGVDGLPFITPEQMKLVRSKMGTIPNSREDIKFIEKKYPVESNSIISIIDLYNWFGN